MSDQEGIVASGTRIEPLDDKTQGFGLLITWEEGGLQKRVEVYPLDRVKFIAGMDLPGVSRLQGNPLVTALLEADAGNIQKILRFTNDKSDDGPDGAFAEEYFENGVRVRGVHWSRGTMLKSMTADDIEEERAQLNLLTGDERAAWHLKKMGKSAATREGGIILRGKDGQIIRKEPPRE